MQSRMLLQVHDELVFEAPPSETADLNGTRQDRNGIRLSNLCSAVGRSKLWPELARC